MKFLFLLLSRKFRFSMNVESRIPIEILFLISQTQQILAISLRTLLVIEWARWEGGVLILKKKWFFLTGFAHFDILDKRHSVYKSNLV